MGRSAPLWALGLAVVVAASVTVGCGEGTDSAVSAGAPSTTAPPTSAPTSAPPTTAASSLADCPRDGTDDTTTTDWVTRDLPDGVRLAQASTTIVGATDAPAPPFVTVLVGPPTDPPPGLAGADIPYLSSVTVERGVPSEPSARGDAWALTTVTVRGVDGRVGRSQSRGGLGPVTAFWDGAGVTWAGSSPNLDAAALVAVLDGLDLSGDVVSDPSGAYRTVGSGATVALGPARVTSLEVHVDGERPEDARVLYLRIDPSAPGTDGPTRLPGGGVGSVTEVDGRVLLLGGEAVTTTDDASQVSVRVYDGQSRPVSLDATAVDAIRTAVAALHRREPSDEALVAAFPADGAPGVGTSAATCIER